MANFLAPRGIDLSHYNYVVMDGLYYSFLYIKAGGYPSRVRAGWMSSLINAGEGVDIDVHLRRENRSRTIDKVAQRIRLNRTKLKSMQDTSTDYEELTNSIQAGYFIKNGIANYNEDLFYMSVFITVSAKTYEELLWRKQQMVDMLKSMDMYTSECSFQQEAALQSVMPFLKISPKLEKKAQRNVLTSGAASSYIFTSFELSDDNGVLLGINRYNNSMGIISHCYDLHSGFDLINCEIPERPEFVFWHPPYWDLITYSDVMYKASEVQSKYGYDPRQFDLSRIPKWEDFVRVMNYAMMKQFCALERGGRMAVLVGDIKKKGQLYSMLFELIKPGTLENVIIKAQHNCFSNQTQYSGHFIPILHEYLLIIKKDASLVYPILMTKPVQKDIRDMNGATWRDVVAAVLETCQSPVSLAYIYELVEPYTKALKNQWWKEKVRQTLQCSPQLFVNTGRGMWALNRSA